MAIRLPPRGEDDSNVPASTTRGTRYIRFGKQLPVEVELENLPSATHAPVKSLLSRSSTWLIGLVVAALGGVITDSLKGTFGGLVPPIRPLMCMFNQPSPSMSSIDKSKINFLVYDLQGDRNGVEADKLAVALQSLGHRAERTCDRLGDKETIKVEVGEVPGFISFLHDGVSTARDHAQKINAAVAMFGGLLPDGRARLTVVMPSRAFVIDISLKDEDWPSKSGLFEKLAVIASAPHFISPRTKAFSNYLYGLAHEPRAGRYRAAAAEAYVDLIHGLQKTIPPSLPIVGSGAKTPDDSEFWGQMAEGVTYLAELSHHLDHHLVALTYQSWVFRFSQVPAYSTFDGRRAYADRIRRILATKNLQPTYAMRIHALSLCVPAELREALFGDSSTSAPGFQKAQIDFRQFAVLPDYADVTKAMADCRFTERLGFFPRWPPWRPPQTNGT